MWLRDIQGPREVWLLVRVTCFATAVPLLVRLPLARLDALLSVTSRIRRHRRYGGPCRLARCVEVAQQVASPVVRPGCLTRGITLYWFLRRRGYPVELCFGVGQVGAELAGHCWLILRGQAFLEPQLAQGRFSPMYRIPGGAVLP